MKRRRPFRGVGVVVCLTVAACSSTPTPTPSPPPAMPDGIVMVARGGPGTLTRYDLKSGQPGKPIAIDGTPDQVALTSDGAHAYALDSNGAQVVPVDLGAGTAAAPVAVGKLPTQERISRDGKTVYVVDNLGGALLSVDTSSNRATASTRVVDGIDSVYLAHALPYAAVGFAGTPGSPGQVALVDLTTGHFSPLQVGTNPPGTMMFSPDDTVLWVVEASPGQLPSVLIPVSLQTGSAGASINLGHGASAAAMTPDGHGIVVLNGEDGTASVVDTGRRAVVATVKVGTQPVQVAISSDGTTAWVGCALSKTIVPVTLRTGRAGTPIGVSGTPVDLALTPDGAAAWVLSPTSPGNIAAIDVGAAAIAKPLAVGAGPGVVISHDNRTAWVINSLSDSVQRIDVAANSVGARIAVAQEPQAASLAPDGKTLLIVSRGDGHGPGWVTPINPANGVAAPPIPVGPAPSGVVITPDGKTLYVASSQANTITPVDVAALSARPPIKVGNAPGRLLVTPDSKTLFVVSSQDRTLTPIATADGSVGAGIKVAPGPQVTMSVDGKTLYVVGRGDGSLTAFSTASYAVIKQGHLDGNAVSAQITPDGAQLLIVDNAGGKLAFIDTATLATSATLPVGARPESFVLTPNGAFACVLDTSRQKVLIVSVTDRKVLNTVDVAPDAIGLAVTSPY